jgi:hypothetical protein
LDLLHVSLSVVFAQASSNCLSSYFYLAVAVLKVIFAIMQGASAWKNLGYIEIREREQAQKKE